MENMRNSQAQTQNQEHVQVMVAIPTNIAIGESLAKSDDELIKEINEELEMNPALEKKDDVDSATDSEVESTDGESGTDSESTDGKDDYRDSYDEEDRDPYAGGNSGSDSNYDDLDDVQDRYYDGEGGAAASSDYGWVSGEETLSEHLEGQLMQFDFTPTQETIAHYVIGSLDPAGRLPVSNYQLQTSLLRDEDLEVSEKEIEHVVNKIKTLDPIGVGARDLRECLLLQLGVLSRAKGGLYTKAYDMVDRYLEDLAKKKFERIMRSLKIDETEMDKVHKIIQRLDPKPGLQYSSGALATASNIVKADIKVAYDEENDSIVIESLNRIPALQVSESYRLVSQSKAASASEKQVKKVATDYLSRATKFMEIIRNRQTILMKVVRAIAMHQIKYFKSLDECDLAPLKLREIAAEVGVDVSMVSRATKDRYIETENGCVPLKLFFSEGLSTTTEGEDASQRRLVKEIEKIIAGEDPTKPLTDEKITKILKEKGFKIERRTVAKYRETFLKLPVASKRRRLVLA